MSPSNSSGIHQSFGMKILEVLEEPRVGNTLEVQRARRVRDIWREATCGKSTESISDFFLSCANHLQTQPVETNELRLAVGRPVEKQFLSVGARREQPFNSASSIALQNAHDELLEASEKAEDVLELRNLVVQLQALSGRNDVHVQSVQRKLICAMLTHPIGNDQGIRVEVERYLGVASISFDDDDELSKCDLEKLMIINAAARIIEPALGRGNTSLLWCREFLSKCLIVQEKVLRLSKMESRKLTTLDSIARNRKALADVHRTLNIPAESLSPEYIDDVLQSAIRNEQLPHKFRQLIQEKARICESHSAVEALDARQYLSYIKKHPSIRKLSGPNADVRRTNTSAEAIRARVESAREHWNNTIFGQTSLRDKFLFRLGVWLDAGIQGNHILLRGPSGVGKTELAKLMQVILQREMVHISGDTQVRPGQFIGNEGMYRNTKPGRLAMALLDSKKSPIIFIDEFGRAPSEVQQSLVSALDVNNNSAYVDAFLGEDAPFDLSEITFLLTSNFENKIDKAIFDRCDVFDFDPLSRATKKYIIKRQWPKLRAQRFLPNSLGLSDKAIDIILDKREEYAGARQILADDIPVLLNWAHGKALSGTLPANIDGYTTKRLVEQTWVDVSAWPGRKGFFADVRLGSVGHRPETHEGSAIFFAEDRIWRVRVVDNNFEVSLASGAPISGYVSVSVQDNKRKSKHVIISASRNTLSTQKVIKFIFSPALPKHGDMTRWKDILERNEALNLRVGFLMDEFFFLPKKLMEEVFDFSQRRSGQFDL